MSERRKLMDELIYRNERKATAADFIIAWSKLVENCKHEKTHWIQELDSDSGEFHNDLVKRCYICGVNIDELSADRKFVEQLLKKFDDACEKEKKTVLRKETKEEKPQ